MQNKNVATIAMKRKEGESANSLMYRFNKKVIAHLFCKHCGVQPFGRGQDPATGAETVAINVRTLAGVDLSKLTLTPFDGKNW